MIVLPKLTYPEEKVLTIEITEDPISGRVISIPIQYEDILHADCFNGNKDDAYEKTRALNTALNGQIGKLSDRIKDKDREIADIQKLLDKANVEINKLKGKLQKKHSQYLYIERRMAAMIKAYNDMMKIKDQFPTSLADILEDETPDNVKSLDIYSMEDE